MSETNERKRMGRPSKSDDERRQTLNLRFKGALIRRIEAAAEAGVHSRAEEVEGRVARSFELDDLAGGKLNAVLVQGIASVLALTEERIGQSWMQSQEARETIRTAINAYLDVALEPKNTGLLGPTVWDTERWISKFISAIAKAVDGERRGTGLFPQPKPSSGTTPDTEAGLGLLGLLGKTLQDVGRQPDAEPKPEPDKSSQK